MTRLDSLGLRIAAGLAATFGLAAGASAQWTVISLHPAGATASEAVAVRDGQEVGYAIFGGIQHASLWSGTATSFVDLHPFGSDLSICYGVEAGHQYGSTQFNGVAFANDWSGTAASRMEMRPGGAGDSVVLGAAGGYQVGSATFNGQGHAGMWNGTAASWIDLNPPGSNWSDAWGVGDGQQVGDAQFGPGPFHAILWTGSAASWVDLSPGSTDSFAMGTDGGQQAGVVRDVAGKSHASFWRGTAASWVDLSPVGSSVSESYGVHSGQQVGYAQFGPLAHAGIWSGSAASWVDLQPFLPPKYTGSFARGIWHDADTTYVVGTAFNSELNRIEAVMWVTSNSFAPTDFSLFRGKLLSGGLAELANSDDQRMVLGKGITLNAQEPPIALRVDGVAPFATGSELKISVESQANTPGLTQWIDLFDYTLNDWVNVDARIASVNSDSLVSVTEANPSRFIEPGTRAVRAQIRYRALGLTLFSSWQAKVDQVQWRLTP